MPTPTTSDQPTEPVRLNWSVVLAAGACLLVIYLPEARSLGDIAVVMTIVTVIVALIGMRLAPKSIGPAIEPRLPISSCLVLFLVGAVLTALFWHRAWMALPSVWGARPLMTWTQIIGFWWPGVLFAALCRHGSEYFAPASRKRYSAQLWWGLAGAAAGVVIQIVLLGFREGWT